MSTHLSPADARQRAYLEARRAYLAGQVDALREQALGLWRLARTTSAAGGDSGALEELAKEAEATGFRYTSAILAIEDELGEDNKAGS